MFIVMKTWESPEALKAIREEMKKPFLEEQFWSVPTFEGLLDEYGLEAEEKIRDFRYRWDKHNGEYVVRFFPTEKFDVGDLFNYFDHPEDKYENWRKWFKIE